VARPREGSRQNSIGGPRVSLLHQLHACARALLARPWSARCYGVARPREGSRQNSIGGPRVSLLHQLHACARALLARPWSARCYGVSRQRERSRQNSIGGLGRAFTPAFRAGSLSLNPWRVGAEESAAAKDGF